MKKKTFGVKKLIVLAFSLVLAACGGTGSPANGGTDSPAEPNPDPHYVGTVGEIEFRVENVTYHAAILAAFNEFLGNDNGATSLAALTSMGASFSRIVITGVRSETANYISFNNGSELRGKIGSGVDIMAFIMSGHFGGPVGALDNTAEEKLLVGGAQQ